MTGYDVCYYIYIYLYQHVYMIIASLESASKIYDASVGGVKSVQKLRLKAWKYNEDKPKIDATCGGIFLTIFFLSLKNVALVMVCIFPFYKL